MAAKFIFFSKMNKKKDEKVCIDNLFFPTSFFFFYVIKAVTVFSNCLEQRLQVQSEYRDLLVGPLLADGQRR